jgi:hypothetical protein
MLQNHVEDIVHVLATRDTHVRAEAATAAEQPT